MKIISSGIHVVIVGGGVDYKLNVMGPLESGVQHFDFLPIVVMVRNGSVEHAKPLWCGQVSPHHADVHFGFTWLGVSL